MTTTVSAGHPGLVGLIAVGPMTEHIAEASCDANGIGWFSPGVVTGHIDRYQSATPLEPGAIFDLADYDAGCDGDAPIRCSAEYLGPSLYGAPFYGEFRPISEWVCP